MSRNFIPIPLGSFLPGVTAQIAQGDQISSAIAVQGLILSGLMIPAVFTGTAMTFLVGDDEDGFQASGQLAFTGTCTDGDTVEFNGVTLTFVDVDPGVNEVLIGATAAETAANLQTFLDATEDEDLLAFEYTTQGAVMLVNAVVHGMAGNALTFVESSTNITASPSGGTLAGGGFQPLYNASNAPVSMTVAAGRCYAIDPTSFQGISFLKFKSGSAELAGRTLFCQLRG